MRHRLTVPDERHCLSASDAATGQFRDDCNSATMKAAPPLPQSDLAHEQGPSLSSPAPRMIVSRRDPTVILTLSYQLFNEGSDRGMQGGCVRLPCLGPEGDDAAGEIHIVAKVYPSFCDAAALVPGNLKGCVQHIAQDVALNAFNFLSDEFDVHLRQFRFTLRFVLADAEADGWISLYETTIQRFVKNDPKYVNLIKSRIVTCVLQGDFGVVFAPPLDVIETMRAHKALRPVYLTRRQKQAQNLPSSGVSPQSPVTVPVTHLKPVIDPTPSGAARFMIEATNLFSGKFRFKSKSLSNFNWIFGRVPKAGGKGTAVASRIDVTNPEVRGVGAFVEVGHVSEFNNINPKESTAL